MDGVLAFWKRHKPLFAQELEPTGVKPATPALQIEDFA